MIISLSFRLRKPIKINQEKTKWPSLFRLRSINNQLGAGGGKSKDEDQVGADEANEGEGEGKAKTKKKKDKKKVPSLRNMNKMKHNMY